MIELLITGGVGILTTIIGSWAAWYFTRKKYNSEVDGNLIENLQKSLEFYDKLSNDNKLRLEKALEENKVMRNDVDALTAENKKLKESMATLLAEDKKLKSELTELRKQVKQLTSLIENKNEKSNIRKTVRKSSAS